VCGLDVLAEDSADYVCQIVGPENTVIANVTHSVIVSGSSVCLSVRLYFSLQYYKRFV